MLLLYTPVPALFTAATAILYVVERVNPEMVASVVAPPDTLITCVLLFPCTKYCTANIVNCTGQQAWESSQFKAFNLRRLTVASQLSSRALNVASDGLSAQLESGLWLQQMETHSPSPHPLTHPHMHPSTHPQYTPLPLYTNAVMSQLPVHTHLTRWYQDMDGKSGQHCAVLGPSWGTCVG